MTRLLIAALALFLAVACGPGGRDGASRSHQQQDLQLLTALPLAWSTAFGLEQPASAVFAGLEKQYRIRLIDLPSDLPARGLLLAAQPRALPAEQLVALDRWVRDGGRLLLLADPLLAWPDPRPLGDPMRPPSSFADTGLLLHWGLRLDAPDQPGRESRLLDGRVVTTVSPGRLVGDCVDGDDGLVARCPIGKGRVTVVADADWLNVDNLGGSAAANVEVLVAELRSLERHR